MGNDKSHPKMYMYKRIVEAKNYMDTHYHEKIDLNNISDQAHFSKYHFLRLFKNAFGKSPHKYLTEVRLLKSQSLLENNLSIKEACFEVGFDSIPSFISLFKKYFRTTPNEYVKKISEQKRQKQLQPLSFIPSCFVSSYGWDK